MDDAAFEALKQRAYDLRRSARSLDRGNTARADEIQRSINDVRAEYGGKFNSDMRKHINGILRDAEGTLEKKTR